LAAFIATQQQQQKFLLPDGVIEAVAFAKSQTQLAEIAEPFVITEISLSNPVKTGVNTGNYLPRLFFKPLQEDSGFYKAVSLHGFIVFCKRHFVKYFCRLHLTFFAFERYSPLIATHKAAIGIGTPSVQKRTGADKRYFCVPFQWQCAWENLRVRRFFCSGSSNPMYAVALDWNRDDSHPLLQKETAMSASTTVVLECTNSAEFYRAIDCVKALNEVLGIVADHPSRQPSPDTLCILHSLLDDFLTKILDGVEEIEVVDHGDEENPLRSFILDDGEDAETCELLDIDDIKDILIDAAKRHAADLSLTSDCTYSKGLTAHEFVLGDTRRPIRIDLNLNSHDPHGAVDIALLTGAAHISLTLFRRAENPAKYLKDWLAAALRLIAKHEPDAWADTQDRSCKGALASLYRAEEAESPSVVLDSTGDVA
jgi:hypothetical protein